MLERGLWCLRVRVRKCLGWRMPGIPKLEYSHDASAVGALVRKRVGADRRLSVSVKGADGESQVSWNFAIEIELKSLILAQIERWRHALHMQVERGEGATSHLVANG